ncbi:MAG: manganese efflux pump [Clostridia bacterium]|nr:manganese efflux pump [Clostridia bacterium]
MNLDFMFFFTNIIFGIGLAMDAFSVSLANGLGEPKMKTRKMCLIAGTFALFQLLMPYIGWFLVWKFVDWFSVFEKFIPWIALVLLSFIGGKMLYEGIKNKEEEAKPLNSIGALILQAVATSIDALSVGFTISDYNWCEALLACTLIGIVTFIICMCGVFIGKKAGTKLAGKAGIVGGIILIAIGLEIFITSWF